MDDWACERLLSKNPKYNTGAFQARHQQDTNVSTYRLDAAYPGRLRPRLLDAYLCISLHWHRWLGFKLKTDGKEPGMPVKKRKIMVEADTQTTPKKIGRGLDIEIDMADSPETKKLKRDMMDIGRLIEMKMEAKEIRNRLG
jgi:hypothetical protein